MGLITKIFGTHSDHELKRIKPIVDRIESLEPEYEQFSDEQLAHKTVEFKERLAGGETLDDILPEAYAAVREAAKRTLGQRAFRVQLIGGIVLHQGRIAEMKTGEGKTLVLTFPSYLNALTGRGVHVVTVNDYLAKRDSEWMGQIHRFLGLTVGCILNHMDNDERRAQYACDITYGTNNEFGFDYLRDNMVVYKERLVMRDLAYAIIDEVDSVLIDEARTPLIISGQSGKSTKLYEVCDILARQLTKGTETELSKMDIIMGEQAEETGDYVVNEKERTVNLTEQGVHKVEQFFRIENLADAENLEIQHNVNLALKAHNLFQKDHDYVVKDDEVLIVDDFTGRILPGRRYSDGLHQAIEAKEHVKVKRESRTLATITFQNFFNKYEKKCGATGTAQTEEREFREIYGMDVVCIPTNKPVARIDHEDAVYRTKREKLNAIVDAVVESHNAGQPVLVGTITIEASETISDALRKRNIPHKVLNAKFHEIEAEIIAEAGKKGAVTIATNMAGRGTDIRLGGALDIPEDATPEQRAELTAESEKRADEIRALGGLKIIGTERHESRRIDNQLRGRSGRQGDPGESRFYISLEDDLMRLFGSERMMGIFKTLGLDDGQEIHHKMLSNVIERAQKRIEDNNFGIRKNVLEYDRVNNEQREIIYGERRKVLDGENMRENIMKMADRTMERLVGTYINDDVVAEEWDLPAFNKEVENIFDIPMDEFTPTKLAESRNKDVLAKLEEAVHKRYAEQEAQFPPEQFREIERVFLLRSIDRKWMNHIDDMEQLKQGIGLQSFGQRDPVQEYKFQGYDMFNEMTDAIAEDTIRALMHIRVQEKAEREEVAKVTGTNKDDSATREPVRRSAKKIMPNDPCPCGSGKKYKFCCMKKDALK
ncbi:MAG: preprotein translocase subunit SecA [Lachnospiraceae bacterium]|nr:preprotein translocase subunit SecA [Lachnospiraceae bacterium]